MTARDLQVTVRERGPTAVLELHGEIDRSAGERLAAAFGEVTGDDAARGVVLNFEHVDYINSTGIAVIVSLLAQARAHGVQMSACGLSAHYREIFEITRLADFMTIAESEDAAVGAAARSSDG